MDDLVQFLRARLDEDEQAARRAGDSFRQIGETGVIVATDGDRAEECASANWAGIAEHIVRHDPARVLREVDAKRRMLDDLLAERHTIVEDCWYTCAAATEERDGDESCDEGRQGGPCDCGRDARVNRRLRLLVLPHADHPDYKDVWRP
ncbi:DUF6221 family protein [Streptomyces sp. NPDC006267]|uniref:DUF6221 family protein n=1 Tax=Streptomyces sp. NPDC006267 TaxID=3157173 RepID=UPI0033B0C7BD